MVPVSFAIGYIGLNLNRAESDMTIVTAEKKATEIAEKYNMGQMIPFDPIKLAELNGIEVKNAHFKEDDISGIISKKAGKTTILVKADDPYNRKRFTIAHELGHYFLHLENVDNQGFVDTVNMYRNVNSPKNESEISANNFAANLLMNEVLVKALWTDVKSVQTMADIFKVSYDAMTYRLANLGLL